MLITGELYKFSVEKMTLLQRGLAIVPGFLSVDEMTYGHNRKIHYLENDFIFMHVKYVPLKFTDVNVTGACHIIVKEQAYTMFFVPEHDLPRIKKIS